MNKLPIYLSMLFLLTCAKETLREIFQDNDQGDSGYEPD